jgi:D-alanyl-D-alanine carboxypeptidase/D-alanyl-D-alanine-endopeptidase (penicillin-binding protein 4)
MVAEPAVARAHWGVMVTALDGTPIYGLNEGQLFQPASTAKLFSTAAAMALLGEDKRFETQVVASGEIDAQGVLHGDLKLVGGGDPSFGTHDLPYVTPSQRLKSTGVPPPTIADIEELADKVYAAGVRRIEGNVLGDDWMFNWEPYPPDWALDDLVYGYGAPVSALSVHDNEIEVKVSPGAKSNAGGYSIYERATVQIDPDLPYYTIKAQVSTGHTEGEPTPGCNLIGYQRAQEAKNLSIYMPERAIEPDQAPCIQAVSIADPAEYAAMAVKAALERRGVIVTGVAEAKHSIWNYPDPATRVDPFAHDRLHFWLNQPYTPNTPTYGCMAQRLSGGPNEPKQTVLATHESARLAEDVKFTMKVSQNLHAEVLLRDVGAAAGCEHTHASGLTVLREFLPHIGVQAGDFVLVDGSGLSGHDLVTPRAEAKLLSYAAHDPKTGQPQPWFAPWKASLPVGGVDGSLEGRFTKAPLKGHVFAKTGTLGEARALSGYLECKSGRTVVFSIMVGNHLPGSTADRDVMDRIVGAIWAAE